MESAASVVGRVTSARNGWDDLALIQFDPPPPPDFLGTFCSLSFFFSLVARDVRPLLPPVVPPLSGFPLRPLHTSNSCVYTVFRPSSLSPQHRRKIEWINDAFYASTPHSLFFPRRAWISPSAIRTRSPPLTCVFFPSTPNPATSRSRSSGEMNRKLG